MEIRCRCTGCAARFKVEAKYAGKKARCPKCQAIVDVPLANDESSASVPVQPKPGSGSPLGPTPSGGSQIVPPKPGVTTTAIPVTRTAAPAPSASDSTAAAGPATSATASEFPLFTKQPSTASDSSAGSSTALRARKKSSALPLVLGGGALLAIAAAVAVGLLLANSGGGGGGDGKGGKGPGAVASNKATLHLDWPQSERSGGSLVIDGQRRAISSAGELQFTLTAGEHKIVALRRGFEPFDATVTLAKGDEEHLAPEWKAPSVAVVPPAGPSNPTTFPNPSAITPAPSKPGSGDFPIGTAVQTATVRGFSGWQQMMELAKRQAVEQKKDVLVVFGCSDAQRATQELARELDQAGVTNSHVCVVIDFPRTSEGLEALADRGQNEMLAEEYGVKSLPALALADEQGRVYFLKREWEEGLGGLQAKIVEWSKAKGERDALLAAAEQGSETERLQAAAKVVKWMQDKTVWRFYGQEIGQWMAAAERVDPENKQAVLEVFFEPQWFLNLVKVNEEDAGAVARVASMLDPWVARKFQDQDRGAKLHMTAGFMLAQVERFDEATVQIEHAVKYQPKDAKLSEAIEEVKRRLANKDLLGTGTGFLISSAGYVLTNHHVIDGEGRIEVRLPGQADSIPAEVIAKDDERDMALLKIALPASTTAKPLAVAPGDVGRGDAVAAFGFPLSTTLGSGLKFTQGVISALPDPTNQDMYLLDLRVNPGNSGGPLCDSRGNVVGMITAKTGNFGFEDSYALSIPAADLIKFLDQHLPQGTPRAQPSAATEPMTWGQVDRQVNTGVLMILNKKK